MKRKSGGWRKKRGRNAEKNHLNHPDSTICGSGDVVQLGLFPAGHHQSNRSFTAAGVASEFNLGVVLMAVAGVLFVVAVMTFLMVCCLLVNGGDD